MSRILKYSLITMVVAAVMLPAAVALSGCGSSSTSTQAATTSTTAPVSNVIGDRAQNVLASIASTGDFANNIVSAAGLSALLNDATKKDTVFVLDVRQKADFDKGHIAGAINIDLNAVAVPGNLQQLPKNQKIVVVCYSGNTADRVVTVLRMLDFDAVGLKYRMMSWDGTGKADYLKYIQAANKQVTTQ